MNADSILIRNNIEMYITHSYDQSDNFDWDNFFSKINRSDIVGKCNKDEIFLNIRELLKENKFKLSFSFSKMMRELLSDIQLNNYLNILELGAATGFLTRWLLHEYDGRGVLVDKSKEAFLSFSSIKDEMLSNIKYVRKDVFELELKQKFDIVCSFGLIEHFSIKKQIIAQHKKFLSENGYLIISVPADTPLTRVFMEVHPELNLGYRELLNSSELKLILENEGLKVKKMTSSRGYVYDFLVAICVL